VPTTRESSGIVVFRRTAQGVEVLLGHMGGPFWARRDDAGWSFPKGEHEPGEDGDAAARREFVEELGVPVPAGALLPLGSQRQSSGKVVTLWALEGDVDLDAFAPGTFTMEWPRGSGRQQEFPEIDRIGWFDLDAATGKLVVGQRAFLARLRAVLAG
jgi:predicted NUDIX family NTP pyrophosphohydrolase